jgi:hypothetical protein
MLMSLPEFCHTGRTPAAVVLSVMADVIGFCGNFLVLSVMADVIGFCGNFLVLSHLSVMADVKPLLRRNYSSIYSVHCMHGSAPSDLSKLFTCLSAVPRRRPLVLMTALLTYYFSFQNCTAYMQTCGNI